MRHGGDIYRNSIQLDYSVNMNPLGVPQSVTKALMEAVQCCSQYPDLKQEQLKKALVEYENKNMEKKVIECEHILCGNGASELFVAVEHAIRPKKTLIPVPSFYGYEHASLTGQSEICFYSMKSEIDYRLDEEILDCLSEEIDLLYLANPNNPTGQLIPVSLLREILMVCENYGIYVVLDECFLPFCEEESAYLKLFEENSFPHLIRIRAFTKTFSIPGVRLGYLICKNPKLKDRIETQLPEWNLSVFAQMAGVAAAKEQEFLDRSRRLITKERQWLTNQLTQLGYRVVPSTTNFILFQSNHELYEKLLACGILIRDCSNYHGLTKGYYRIAVKTREENEKLIDMIKLS